MCLMRFSFYFFSVSKPSGSWSVARGAVMPRRQAVFAALLLSLMAHGISQEGECDCVRMCVTAKGQNFLL